MTPRASFGLIGCLAALALAGCASTPPEDDPVQIKLRDLDTRVTRVERAVADQSLELSNQVESMRKDLRAMHNDVDELTNSLEAAHKQQRDLYADLDRRM
ncbi:MAG: YbgF trimerization domain-containing protein, partial [Steroidobacteraceae bacterium]